MMFIVRKVSIYRFNKRTQVLELEIIDVDGHDKIRRIIGFKN